MNIPYGLQNVLIDFDEFPANLYMDPADNPVDFSSDRAHIFFLLCRAGAGR